MLAQTATHTEFISSRYFDAPCLTGQWPREAELID